MTRFASHPSPEARTRAADDESSPEERDVLAAHVADCRECATEITWVQSAAARLSALPTPALDASCLSRALSRRMAGERVLLPTDDVAAASRVDAELDAEFDEEDRGTRALAPAAASRTRTPPWARAGRTQGWAAAALIVVAGIGAWWSLAPRGLEAATPAERLRIVGGLAQAGQRVTLEYAAFPELAAHDSLVVRAFGLGDGGLRPATWHDPLAVLHRSTGRTYRGEFVWPNDAASLTASVETIDGSAVDANDGDLVDLLATDGQGVPTFEALLAGSMRGEATFYAPGGRQWPRVLAVRIAELQRRFPDRPETWALAATQGGSPSLWDAWFGAFARRTRALQRLDLALGKAPALTGRERRAMLALARAQEEPEVASEWAARVGGDTVIGEYAIRARRIDDIVARRDLVAARAFLRDSLRSTSDYLLAVDFGTYRHVGEATDHPALVPCGELQASFARAHAQSPMPRRPIGVTSATYARYREWRWNSVREVASLCGLPYQERRARYVAWARAAAPLPADEALRALWRQPSGQ